MQKRQNAVKTVQVTVISDRGQEKKKDPVVCEHTLSIVLNKKNLLTLICSPEDLPALAVGHLFTQGFISRADEVENVEELADNRTVSIHVKRILKADRETVLPPGGMKLQKVRSGATVSFRRITELVRKAEERCDVFSETGGAHACALSDTGGIVFFSEDIGRHNAIDRVIGRCLLDGVPFRDKLLFTTGRVSSVILAKSVRAGVPLLVSRSAPSFEAVRLAEEYGVTLAGFARGGRLNVYAGRGRIV